MPLYRAVPPPAASDVEASPCRNTCSRRALCVAQVAGQELFATPGKLKVQANALKASPGPSNGVGGQSMKIVAHIPGIPIMSCLSLQYCSCSLVTLLLQDLAAGKLERLVPVIIILPFGGECCASLDCLGSLPTCCYRRRDSVFSADAVLSFVQGPFAHIALGLSLHKCNRFGVRCIHIVCCAANCFAIKLVAPKHVQKLSKVTLLIAIPNTPTNVANSPRPSLQRLLLYQAMSARAAQLCRKKLLQALSVQVCLISASDNGTHLGPSLPMANTPQT